MMSQIFLQSHQQVNSFSLLTVFDSNGTGSLVFEANASAKTRSGEVHFFWRNKTPDAYDIFKHFYNLHEQSQFAEVFDVNVESIHSDHIKCDESGRVFEYFITYSMEFLPRRFPGNSGNVEVLIKSKKLGASPSKIAKARLHSDINDVASLNLSSDDAC